MNDYVVLVYPSANRVYADQSAALLIAELRVFDHAILSSRLAGVTESTIGGVPCVTFTAPPLDEHDVALLSNISSLYALFERVDDDLLRPVELRRRDVFDSDLLTIQKYSGKTNELFTKLVLNITTLSTDRPDDLVAGHLRVLDPMCGRGTTLNQAMMYGADAAGLEIDGKDFEEYGRFIRTWLKNKRIKHQATATPIRREHSQLGRRLDISLGVDKENYKAGNTIRLSYVHGDTVRSAEFFRPGSFDVIVTDAPYGIKHGSRAERLSRTPTDLLRAALPGWAKLLRPGGAMGISWNTHVAGRDELAAMVTGAGLLVRADDPYLGFEHRVDQAIVRDVLVATKDQ